jgi:hypothetical protein
VNGKAFVRFLISRFFSLSAVLFCFPPELHSQTPFSLDSADSYLRILAVEIGPRPMGSAGELKAMEFAVGKFRQFGLENVSVMPFSVRSNNRNDEKNRSGVVVGILPGKTDRQPADGRAGIIVIGGHIDSAGPDIPGANDNASGSAVVIELARVLSQRSNESTIVFALFGGEERGLRGSRHFVEHFPAINSVVLMLQIDMANGSEWLLPLIDSKEHSSPQWLVSAAYEEFTRLGYSGFSFPTHLMNLNSMFGSYGISSDHLPFLELGIPAIDFTSDVNDPIHTPNDTYENFRIEGLKRSGDLVYRLVERFDAGVPEERTGRYLLFDVVQFPIFIPVWLLTSFIILSIVLALVVVVVRRRKKTETTSVIEEQPSIEPRFPGWKLFLMMLIIQICVWLSESAVALMTGVRFPWMTELSGYIALSFIGGCIGIWISLQLVPILKLPRAPEKYFLRSVVFLFLITLLLGAFSPKPALAPAAGMFFLSLALLVRPPLLKLFFWILSSHFMYRLIFSEGFELMARSFTNQGRTPLEGAIVHIIYILFFSLWSFPFLLGFAAIYFDSGRDLMWLNRYRGRRGLVLSVLAFGGTFGYVMVR